MKWNRTDLLLMLTGLIPAAVALMVYQRLPEQVATHISYSGEADNWMARPWAILMWALLGGGIPLLTKAMRWVDPKSGAFLRFEGVFTLFRWAITLFMVYAGLAIIAKNLGYDFSTKWITSLGLGVLFMIIGNSLGKIRFNYTFGIRTPWTLANEEVWHKTHRLAGFVWFLSGALMAVGILLPGKGPYLVSLILLAGAVGIPTLYSLMLYQNIRNR